MVRGYLTPHRVPDFARWRLWANLGIFDFRPIPTTMTTDPTHDEITLRARSLWEERGQPSGQDDDIWLQAERELRGRSNRAPDASRSSARTDNAEMSASRPGGRERTRQRRTQNA